MSSRSTACSKATEGLIEGSRTPGSRHPRKVAEIARSCQFLEPGRFAVTCRTDFGEVPSATLRPELHGRPRAPKAQMCRNRIARAGRLDQALINDRPKDHASRPLVDRSVRCR